MHQQLCGYITSFFLVAGNDSFNQIVEVLLSTSMFVGGFTGFFLDNTLPGNYDAIYDRIRHSIILY